MKRLLFLLIPLLLLSCTKESKLEVGQKWLYGCNVKNPFEDNKYYIHEIIDIQDDYVLYTSKKVYELNESTGLITFDSIAEKRSTPKSFFIINAILLDDYIVKDEL